MAEAGRSGTGPTELVDAADRREITTGLDRNLFVEAGAGSGKTSSLVSRIVQLVESGVPVNRIAAITFTEAAARELRVRVRDALDTRATDSGNASLAMAAGQVESAAFSTLHGFALRLLAEHPIEADLPPGFGVVDEITSTLEFDESWRVFRGRVGDDLSLQELQVRAAAMGIELQQFAGVARRFDDNWDLLDLVDREPPVLSEMTFDDLLDGIDELESMLELCISPDDAYHGLLRVYVDEVNRLSRVDELDQVQSFRQLRVPHRGRGRQDSWRGIGLPAVKAAVDAFNEGLRDRIDVYRSQVMDYFVVLIADFVRRRVEVRQTKGELAFHDLLVLARRLLRRDEVVRQTLHQRYTRILLDEFQDTDPIQIELAVLLAAAGPVGERGWPDLVDDIEPGRLVVVGDPKQSIYRFRRADIAVYAQTEDVLVDETTRLTTNFRSVPGILAWVNHLFAAEMGEGTPGVQPAYVALDAAREPGPTPDPAPGPVPGDGETAGTGGEGVGDANRPPVAVLGGPHPRETKIQQIREIEGRDVAAVVCRAVDEAWPVLRDGQWRPVRLSDIAVLIPSRLSLPSLEAAFASANVPFRPETNSLVYATQEVRDVLAGVRAVVDPTNSVDVVATLRSALFALSDDALLDWKLAGGSWDYRRTDLDDPTIGNPRVPTDDHDGPVDGDDSPPTWGDVAGHPVAEAFAVLATWHADRWWSPPAALIDRIVRERRLREAALAEPRPRDRWRRYRFLAEQARAFAETQGGDLHDFVEWVEIQASDLARVTEPIPSEPDDDAVRVLTIHGAKGLEFPVVVLAGAPTSETGGRAGPQVLFPPGERPQVRLGKDRQTADYDVHASMEEILDANERIRLHYVAATRARDHLVVSAHHKETGPSSIGRRTWAAIQDRPDLWQAFERRGDEHYAVRAPTQLRLAGGDYREEADSWRAIQDQIVAAAGRVRSRSATELAATDPGRRSVDELPAPRAAAPTLRSAPGPGAALGLAVHAVLEELDFDRPDAELHRLAASCAADAGLSDPAPVVDRVMAALGAPSLELARRHPHHRELYVAGEIGGALVEGFVDLCVETEDGLVIVDYKTDHLVPPIEEAVAAKLADYRLQGATYAVLLSQVTGRTVVGCRFVFLGADSVVEAEVDDLERAMADLAERL
ncbi:MAG: UvrD-helicase domain-containing protein [Actinomycetota bacterium]